MVTDLLVGAAAAVAAAAGAMEAEAASVAIDKIDQSIAKYASTLANRRASGLNRAQRFSVLLGRCNSNLKATFLE